jgi:hypothetical protein
MIAFDVPSVQNLAKESPIKSMLCCYKSLLWAHELRLPPYNNPINTNYHWLVNYQSQ